MCDRSSGWPATRSSPVGWRRDARIRSAFISRKAGISSAATRSIASRSSKNRSSIAAERRGWRSMPPSWALFTRSRAKCCDSRCQYRPICSNFSTVYGTTPDNRKPARPSCPSKAGRFRSNNCSRTTSPTSKRTMYRLRLPNARRHPSARRHPRRRHHPRRHHLAANQNRPARNGRTNNAVAAAADRNDRRNAWRSFVPRSAKARAYVAGRQARRPIVRGTGAAGDRLGGLSYVRPGRQDARPTRRATHRQASGLRNARLATSITAE